MSTDPAPAARRVSLGIVYLVAACHLAMVSFNYLIVKVGLNQFGVFPFASLRFLISSAALWTALSVRGYRPLARTDWKAMWWLALVAIPLNQLPYLFAMQRVPPEHGALIYATTPIWVLIVARLLLGEPITPQKLIGIPLAFLGVCLVFFERGVTFNDTLMGDCILVFGVIGWALYTVQGKPMSEKFGALQATTLAISLGTVMCLPAMPFVLRDVHWSAITPLGWVSLGYMALVTSALAYTIWYWLMNQLETSKVAVLQNLQPVFTMGWTLLMTTMGYAATFNLEQHAITPIFLTGAVLTLAGVLITQRG
ncbi:MAG: DMT family transporter [bacterium]